MVENSLKPPCSCAKSLFVNQFEKLHCFLKIKYLNCVVDFIFVSLSYSRYYTFNCSFSILVNVASKSESESIFYIL